MTEFCYCRSVNMNEMHCMLQLTPSRILLGGQQDKLIDYNLDLCKETMLVSHFTSHKILHNLLFTNILLSHSKFFNSILKTKQITTRIL